MNCNSCRRPKADDGYKTCHRCRARTRAGQQRWRDRGGKAQMRRDYAAARQAVLDAYGGCCACCGENQPEFLTLDHINGVPDHHRDKSGKRIVGRHLYNLVRDEGFPPDYQVLCWNCNAAKGMYGECPHVRLWRQVKAVLG